MNKKATIGETLWDNAIYLILLALFVGGMFLFIGMQRNGASVWGDAYAKEILRVINLANEGDEIRIDVHKATEIAAGNRVMDFQGIFSFDNANKNICVKLSLGQMKCYRWFNDVDVVYNKLELGVPTNILSFKVVKMEETE